MSNVPSGKFLVGAIEDQVITSPTSCSSLISRNKGGNLIAGSNSNDWWETTTE